MSDWPDDNPDADLEAGTARRGEHRLGARIDRSQETYRPSPYGSQRTLPHGTVSRDGMSAEPETSLTTRILVWGGAGIAAAAITAGGILAVRKVADLVAEAARTRPDTLALIDTATGITRTWSEIELAVRATALRLCESGVVPGDRVGVRLPTSPAFVVAFYAALRAGAIVVPLNPYDPDPTAILDHSGTRVVLTDRPVETADVPVTPVEPVLDAA